MDFQVYDVAIVPIIVALVEFCKRIGVGPRLLPLISLAFGIAAGMIYIAPHDYPQAIFVGVVMGLAACGLWSGTKNLAQN
ncbi:hypothetical protein [Marinicrinis lubricantis]|uniref:Holin n=1 Tax=Marinicrinis lubricantis TaxID=2086470 RepID=A0ABW1IJ44_9BACL